MVDFVVCGPYSVIASKGKASPLFDGAAVKNFWVDKADLARSCGCYVFSFRASKGYKPFYIGKATKSYQQEVFSSHKLTKIYEAQAQQKKGTFVVFFIMHPRSKGKVNKVAIDEAETFLIQSGMAANPVLLNDRKVAVDRWSIKGVLRSGRGQPTISATKLKQCLKLT